MMAGRWLLMAGVMGILAGCGTAPVQVETVRIPLPVTCLRPEDIPEQPPTASDADLLGMEDRALVLALARDRERMIVYVEQMKAAIKACVAASLPRAPEPETPIHPPAPRPRPLLQPIRSAPSSKPL